MSDAEDRELYEAVENIYVLNREQRRLFTLANMLPRGLMHRLGRWIGDGRYAHLFDNVDDTLTVHAFQVFDFEAMRDYPELLEPLLFYVLHRVTAEIMEQGDGAGLKLCLMDEAWRFIQHPKLRAYVEEGLKTWRKKNAAMVLATQAVDDLASAALLRTVVESCPTSLLLANPALDRAQYAELFRLNAVQLDQLTPLAPRRQLLLKRDQVSKVLTLDVDEPSYGLYTNTPMDHARRTAAVGGPASSTVCRGKPPPRRPARKEHDMRMRCLWTTVSGVALSATLTAQTPSSTAGVREVIASERGVISLATKIRYTTMIILPDEEEILDVLCGDKEFWVINAAHNIAHLKPAKEGAATNLNLVTASGTVYSFLLAEAKMPPDLKVYVLPMRTPARRGRNTTQPAKSASCKRP